METIEINKELEETYDKIEETGKTAPAKKDKETKEYLKGIRGMCQEYCLRCFIEDNMIDIF